MTTIKVIRDGEHKLKQIVHVRQHALAVAEPVAAGGDDEGPTPHEVYDSALGACKAMTVLWYARRKQIPVDDVQVTVERDDSLERQELLQVAHKCPIHKLMSAVTTEISTALVAVQG